MMNKKEKLKLYQFEARVLKTIEAYEMLAHGDRVVVALSGGADSVCLLLVLKALKERLGLTLFACHLNHGIRGKEALRDLEFSKTLCQKLCVDFYSETLDVPALQRQQGGSLETVARNARYAFFERAMTFFNAQRLATAHTMSDNAETLLFNLCRGSSADGLCGIPPKRGFYIRPLIELSRIEIENYLSALGQDYITDSSNESTDYTRNYLRHEIIPRLKYINPELEKSLSRVSRSQATDKDFFEKQLSEISPTDSLSSFSGLHKAVLSRLVHKLCKKATDDAFISQNRTLAILDAIESVEKSPDASVEKAISLSGDISAIISRDGISFEKNSKADSAPIDFNVKLSMGHNIINSSYSVYLGTDESDLPDVFTNEKNVYRLYKKIDCLFDIIKKDIFVRNRQPQDKFRIGGMSRCLKKVFSQAKISKAHRPLLPLVCVDNKIVALPLFDFASDDFLPCGRAAIVAFYKTETTQNKE